MKPVLLITLSAVLTTTPASDFTLLTDDRVITASGSATDATGTDQSADNRTPPAPFDDWSAFVTGVGSLKSAQASAAAAHKSTVTPQSFTAIGDANAQASSEGNGAALALAESRFAVRFSVADTTRVRLQADVNASGDANAWARLTNQQGTTLINLNGSPESRAGTITRALPPGEYEFRIHTDASAALDNTPGLVASGAAYTASFTHAQGCNGADLAQPTNVLDLADLQTFIEAFTSSDPNTAGNADLANPSGVLDLADVQAFITQFTAGCP